MAKMRRAYTYIHTYIYIWLYISEKELVNDRIISYKLYIYTLSEKFGKKPKLHSFFS